MRKSTIFISLLLFITACGKEDIPTSQSAPTVRENETTYYTPEINFKRAESIAEKAPSLFADNLTKGAVKSILNSTAIESDPATKSSNIDTLMYVFNYAEGGYVVVPTVDIKGDVLAYVEEGRFNINDTIDNEMFRYIVRLMINNQIKVKATYRNSKNMTKGITPPIDENIPVGPACGLIEYQEDYGEPVAPPALVESMGSAYYLKYGCIIPNNRTTYTLENLRSPMTKTCWGQNSPFNNKAPIINGKNTVAGCMAVAVAQVMAYHNHPVNYPRITDPNISLYSQKPTQMVLFKDFKYIYDNSSLGARTNVATFMRVIGYLLENKWGVSSSSASIFNIPDVLSQMGYADCQVDNYTANLVRRSLFTYKPVIIRGIDANKGGHAWVIDGEKTVFWKRVSFTDYFDSKGNYNGSSPRTESKWEQYFFHCNFGWVGKGNGYYDDGIFDTSDPLELTNEGVSNGCYDSYLLIITNIQKKQS